MRDDLRARYGEERLPRYTSYPTAPHFSPIGVSRHLRGLARLDCAGDDGFAVSPCAVLPLHVLVLRLPHHRHAASRAYRRLHRGAAG